jgi:hypothetical protein
MKSAMLLLVLLVMLPFFEMACKNHAKKTDTEVDETYKLLGESELMVNAYKIKYEKLISNFIYKTDEFTGRESYVHRKIAALSDSAWNLNRANIPTALFLITFSSNSMGYVASYLGDKIVFNKILIKIDDLIATDLDGEYKLSKALNGFHEARLSNNPRILHFIALQPNKKVLVRFEGEKGKFDFTLDETQHEIICQSVELYNTIGILKRIGVDPSTIVNTKPAKVR